MKRCVPMNELSLFKPGNFQNVLPNSATILRADWKRPWYPTQAVIEQMASSLEE
jgi:hypothetical protein